MRPETGIFRANSETTSTTSKVSPTLSSAAHFLCVNSRPCNIRTVLTQITTLQFTLYKQNRTNKSSSHLADNSSSASMETSPPTHILIGLIRLPSADWLTGSSAGMSPRPRTLVPDGDVDITVFARCQDDATMLCGLRPGGLARTGGAHPSPPRPAKARRAMMVTPRRPR